MHTRSNVKAAHLSQRHRTRANALVNTSRRMLPIIRKIYSVLRTPGAFKSLPALKNPNVRLLEIGDRKFVLKDTLGSEEHGKKFKK